MTDQHRLYGQLQNNDSSFEPPAPVEAIADARRPEALTDYLSARNAAQLLDVKLATLYAYTSRGLVQSVPGERGRARLYRRSDLERLCARRDARAGHGPVAAAALRFGEPVLDSSITEISPLSGPIYRGLEAVDLARADVPFESVVELLWGQIRPEDEEAAAVERRWATDDFVISSAALGDLLPPGLPPLPALAALVPILASHDPGRFVERPEAVMPRGRALIRRMAAALALGGEPARRDIAIREALASASIASAIARALGNALDPRGIAALNRALVLGADHELNASTFAARIAASTGADVYAGVAAALASLSGPRHGGASDRVEALVSQIGSPDAVERVVHDRQRRGEAIEGFGHPLYPDGDPRGAMLVDLARELDSGSRPIRTCLALIDAIERGGGGAPNIDTGLVALALALELPPGSAVGIFAVARSAGWVAHMLEQFEAGYLLRPRARYLGGA